MTKFPSLQKFAIVVLCGAAIGLLDSPAAYGIAGGPFSNGSPLETGAQGTYTATMLGENLVGNMTFAVDQTGGSTGRFFLFHAVAYSTGLASGYVDPMSKTVTGVFGEGAVGSIDRAFGVDGNVPTNDYASGGWTAFVFEPNPAFQFLGSGTVSTSASNITASVASENNSVQEQVIEPIANGTRETQSAVATQDDAYVVTREQVPFTVYGYRSSTNTVSFADFIVQGD